jgi:PTS system mannose-specific IIA component
MGVQMIGIIIASHGDFSKGILDAMEIIIGKQENIKTLILKEGVSPESLFKDYEEAVLELDDGDGVLFLLDLFGGTPSNVAGRLSYNKTNIEVVTGVNLPMLLEVVTQRKFKNLHELAVLALSAGRKGIEDVKKWLEERIQSDNTR